MSSTCLSLYFWGSARSQSNGENEQYEKMGNLTTKAGNK